MELNTFFSINMPYGITRNNDNEWIAFNREYMRLGWNAIENKKSIQENDVYSEFPIYTKYKNLSEKVLLEIAGVNKIDRNTNNEIVRVFFYKDKTDPQYSPEYWNEYFDKLKMLSRLKTN